jgi:hypothetical protein
MRSLSIFVLCLTMYFYQWAVTLFNLNQSRGTWMGNMCSGVHVGVGEYVLYLLVLSLSHTLQRGSYCLSWHLTLDTWCTFNFLFYLTLTTVYLITNQAWACDYFLLLSLHIVFVYLYTIVSKITSKMRELKWMNEYDHII